MNKTALITVGISASGKTTWAEQYASEAIKHTIVVSRDNIRRQILESKLNRPLKPGELWKCWKFKDEKEVTEIAAIELQHAVDLGADIIVADTNLSRGRREELMTKLTALGFAVELKMFPITFEEAVKRDNGRADGVGQSVLMKQWLQFQEEFGVEKYVPKSGTKDAIICDLDGTLAHMSGRSAFEWSRVGEDTVDEVVKTILGIYWYRDANIILLSGRDSVCRPETEQWLKDNDIRHTRLFMRSENDSRKDYDVKYELFNAHIRDHYNVLAVIDDRPQVLRLWHALGLKTISMGNTFIEF